MRVEEMAEKMGLPPQEALELLRQKGHDLQLPSDSIKDELASTLIESEKGKKQDPKTDEVSLKKIEIKPPIVVRHFATLMGLKPFQIISKLMQQGIFASVNQNLRENIATSIAKDFGFELSIRHRGDETPRKPTKKLAVEDPGKLETRPPIVCVLGHVDHGKTTLLDTLRKSKIASGEAGGITQHIGAYQLEHKGRKITFLDTPGHAAFSKMRERGAQLNDVAILVVAGDDGFKPQTDEALKFLQEAKVVPVVAINKMDAKGADEDKVKKQMQERGITSEDWGGTVLCNKISALKNEGIEGLLESLLLQADLLELKANFSAKAKGIVVESQLESGKGPTATVIVQQGTLKVGDIIVSGRAFCRIRALLNEQGEKIQQAPPSTPARLLGFSCVPQVGESFHKALGEKEARKEAEEAANLMKTGPHPQTEDKAALPTTAEDLMKAIHKQEEKVLKIVVKADTQGSLEAVIDLLKSIQSQRVSLEIIDASLGLVSKKDIELAHSFSACLAAFHTTLEPGVLAQSKNQNVPLIRHDIIYKLLETIREAMSALIEPEYREERLGRLNIRAVFPVLKGQAAGCVVSEGLVKKGALARLLHKGKTKHEGKIITLKRFKEEVNQVRLGLECGLQIATCKNYTIGDEIIILEKVAWRPPL